MKFYTCKYDRAFKAIICNQNNLKYLREIINTVLKKRYEDITILNGELLKKNIHTKSKTVDLLLKGENTTIIVELNASIRNNYRNFAYLCNEIATRTRVGEEYTSNYEFYQINLTYGMKDEKEYREYRVQDNTLKKYVDSVSIIEYNMDKLKEYFNNKDEEKIEEYKYLIMLDLDKEELESMKGSKVVMEYKEELENLNKDEEFVEYMTKEEDDEKYLNTLLNEATRNGISIKEKTDVIMCYKNGVEKEKICKIFNLSIEEIDKILEEE